MNVDLSLDELLAELIAREEAMESFAKYVEYVSGMKPPPHLKLVCDKLDISLISVFAVFPAFCGEK